MKPPKALLAELTHRCPLKCPYCSNPLELDRRSGELATDEWKKVLDEAAALGIIHVHFSGGEPTARKDIGDLVSHASAAGLYSNLITSGVLMNEGRLDALIDAGLDHLQLSLQDVEPSSADRIAGFQGGHEKKLALARGMRNTEIGFTVNAVIHRQNIHNVAGFIDLAVEMEAGRLEVAHTQYYGWALKNRAALIPSREQLDEATRVVKKASERLKGRLVIDYVVPDYYARFPKPCMGGWGRVGMNITPSGKALPCHAAETIDGLSFDTVLEKSLQDIWTSSPAFEAFRGFDWMEDPCRSCERRTIDWGGCRCQAFAFTGRATATDPACSLSPIHNKLDEIAKTESAAPPNEFLYRG
ncbi:MAG: pyrroloquinoline quinone biosynthesis protein PqqE [Methyloligellaceae bacterium]